MRELVEAVENLMAKARSTGFLDDMPPDRR